MFIKSNPAKSLSRLVITCCLTWFINVAYGFVGGAHGGFSGGGGYHGGGYVGSHHEYSGSHPGIADPGIFTKVLILFCLILFFLLSVEIIKNKFYKSVIGKKYKGYQTKRYIDKCHYTPLKTNHSYSESDLNNALEHLNTRAKQDFRTDNSIVNTSYDQLINKTLLAFNELQKAWCNRSITSVYKVCNNPKYSKLLENKINKMMIMDVYNFIAETKISECKLVKFYKLKYTQTPVLRFLIKGEQIDEYITKRYLVNPGIFKPRPFNCLLEVIPCSEQFKIYEVKYDQHVDDYVMTEFNKFNKGILHCLL